jgi:hypothetical protein
MPVPEGQEVCPKFQIDTYVPNVEHNDSNKFYFICKFNKLLAPGYSLPLAGGGRGWGLSVAWF